MAADALLRMSAGSLSGLDRALWIGLVLGVWVNAARAGEIHVEDVTEATEIAFRHTYGADELTNLLQTTGPGVCIADFDGDSDLDIYFVNGAPLEPADLSVAPRNALYANAGDGTFVDVTARAGVGDPGVGMGAVAADYDNDGDEDLYVCNFRRNVLYQNRGDGTFEDVTDFAGVACPLWSAAAAFADVDNDGHLDLFVSNYLDFDPAHQPSRSMLSYKEGYRFFPGPYDFSGLSSTLYRNQGDGTFVDVTEDSGIHKVGKGMGCMFSDLDLDGDVDLVVANDRYANFLFVNDGRGHFTDMAIPANVAYDKDGFDTGAMAVAVGDVDVDGYPDMLITNMIFEYNILYRNQHDLTFLDVTEPSSVHEGAFQTVGWGCLIEDFDRDGLVDLFVANGHVQDYIDTFSESIRYEQPNLFFQNRGDGRFENISARAGEALDVAQVSRGCAYGDLDGDELSDIVVVNSADAPQILRNATRDPGSWLRVELVGVRSNRSGVGAKIRVTAGGRTLAREVTRGDSYASQSEPWPRFGLGPYTRVDRLEVSWPSGGLDVYTDLPANRLLIATEGQHLQEKDDPTKRWSPEVSP